MEMISAASNEDTVKAFLAQEIERLDQSGMGIDRPLDNERAEKIYTTIIQSGTEAPVIPLIGGRRRWMRRVAAAAVLILIACGGYLAVRPGWEKDADVAASSASRNDIAPGSNRAVLTLASGKQIGLDSIGNGLLASQGNSSIVKLDSGVLSYTRQRALKSKQVALAYNTLTTPRGGQYQLVLPDGSKVWLNAASSIHFPTAFTGKERRVEITGEAYFEITKNAAMPFTVKKGNLEIQVLGTDFNVNTYDDEASMKITLVEGSVRVIQHATGRAQLLKPGQQAQIGKTGEVTLVEHADIDRVIAWKEGRFEFHGNIEGIMRQIARWYNVDVEYRGNVVKRAYAGAISRYENISKVLQMLQLTGTIHFEILKDTSEGKTGKIIIVD
jgi:ferric-dicitrate binding protein FerR (iron transport regulator)